MEYNYIKYNRKQLIKRNLKFTLLGSLKYLVKKQNKNGQNNEFGVGGKSQLSGKCSIIIIKIFIFDYC